MIDNPLAKDFGFWALLKFAFPTMSMMLFMGLYTIVDTIFVSRFVNTDALSAMNVVCPMINVLVGLGTMIATGGSAIVASNMGAQHMQTARQNFTLLILFGAMLGGMILVLGWINLDVILTTLGANDQLIPYGKAYLSIIFLFAPASMLQVLFQNLFVTAGKPTLGLFLSVCAGGMNIIFDLIFMKYCHMGIAGAALGTGLGYMIPAVGGICYFCRSHSTLYFVKPHLNVPVLMKSCSNGSSEMVSQLATAITTFFFNHTMMKLIGIHGIAAMTILIYTQFLFTTWYIGFAMGVAPILSYHWGANHVALLKRCYKQCITFILISSWMIYICSMLFGNELIQLFTGRTEEVYAITSKGFGIFAIGFLFSGFNIFSSALFTALSDGFHSAMISFCRTFGFLMPCLLILPQFFSATGIWLAIPVAECLTFCGAILLNKRLWKTWTMHINT